MELLELLQRASLSFTQGSSCEDEHKGGGMIHVCFAPETRIPPVCVRFFCLKCCSLQTIPSHHESSWHLQRSWDVVAMVVEIMAASGGSELSRLHKCRDMWDIETNPASAVRCCNKQSAAVHLLSLLSGQPLEASLLPKKSSKSL